jgi:hypothetical protein
VIPNRFDAYGQVVNAAVISTTEEAGINDFEHLPFEIVTVDDQRGELVTVVRMDILAPESDDWATAYCHREQRPKH